jgi:hypothetical protein
MEIEPTPDQEVPEDVCEEAEAFDDSGGGKGGGELFGDPAIPPTLYHCPNHGDVLAQDVVWKRDGRPYCPECGAPLDSE